MGLFDNLASAVGSALGNSGEKGAESGTAGAKDILGNLLQQGNVGHSGGIIGDLLGGLGLGGAGGQAGAGGGLAGILQSLAASGLAEQVTSWVSNNPNLPVSVDQIRDALGSEQVQQLARQSGLPIDEFLQNLAGHLPQAASDAAGVPAGGTPNPPA